MAKRNFIFVGFDNDLHVSGKEVTGVVVAVIQNPFPAERVRILWCVLFFCYCRYGVPTLGRAVRQGRESCAWNDGVRQNTLCAAERRIFEEETTLLSFSEKILNPGTYTYPFRWQLPASLPGSFEESESSSTWIIPENGLVPRSIHKERSYIRYTALAQVEGINVPSLECRSVFRVSESFNPKLIGQPAREVSNSASFLFGGNGELKAYLSLASGGVLFRGQKLVMNLKIKNETSRGVEKVILWLNAFTTFQTEMEEQVLTRKETVFAVDVPNSFVGGGMDWNRDLAVQVPPHAGGSLRKGKFVQRHYELTVEISVSMGSNLILKAPVLLLEWSPILAGLFTHHEQHSQPKLTSSSSSVSNTNDSATTAQPSTHSTTESASAAPQGKQKQPESDDELEITSLGDVSLE